MKYALITGAFIALVAGVLFGVMDIQCRNDPRGKFWNAEQQTCQSREVTQ